MPDKKNVIIIGDREKFPAFRKKSTDLPDFNILTFESFDALSQRSGLAELIQNTAGVVVQDDRINPDTLDLIRDMNRAIVIVITADNPENLKDSTSWDAAYRPDNATDILYTIQGMNKAKASLQQKPDAKGKTPSPKAKAVKGAASQIIKVLIVDDDNATIRSWDIHPEKFLDQAGMGTMVFDTPQEALDFFKRNLDLVDVIITDGQMPWSLGASSDNNAGAKLAAEVKKIRPNTPVILYSTGVSAENPVSAEHRAAGIDAYCAKAASNTLPEMVKKLFEKMHPGKGRKNV